MRTVVPKQYVTNSLGLTKRVSAVALLLGILWPQPAVSAEKLFFASDVHYQLENLANLASSYATSCELACILGDYASSSTTTFSDYKQTYYSMASYVPFTIFTQGNHETFSDGYFNAGTGLNTHSNLQYNIYVINPNDFSNASTALSSFLSTYNENKVLFVLSHYPLHSTRLTTALQNAAVATFNTLQAYGPSKDIVFLWGHNHSSSTYDTGVNYVVRPGGSIRPGGGSNVISAVATATLEFTYLNAGYVNPISGTSPSATVVTVRSDDITIDRYGNQAQNESVTRRVAGDPCGNDSCSSPENACNCHEDCGSATGTCGGACGGMGYGDCYCDDACANLGDCCPDKQSVCGC